MLAAVSTAALRFRRGVLVAAVLFLVLAGAVAGGVADSLSAGGFEDSSAPSTEAAKVLEDQFGGGAPNLAVLVTAPGSIDDPATAEAAQTLVARLQMEKGLEAVTSYWTSGEPPSLKSEDGTKGLVLGRLTGDEDTEIDTVEGLADRYNTDDPALRVTVGGEIEVYRQVGDTIEADLKRAESVAIPVTAVLLVLVFGSAVAALLPLLIGVLSILGTFLVLQGINGLTSVSVYAVNLAISLGLGLGIDYSLFILTRYREEVRAGRERPDAIVRAVQTAGRTVLFSALTVALSLGALLVFPLYFLQSFAYAGIAAVAFASLGAVVVLPAALALLGDRVDRFDLNRPLRRLLRRPERTERVDGEGFWHRLAMTVMKRPVPIATSVVLLLLVLGIPFLSASFGLPDDRVLPRSASAHQVSETVRTEFPSNDPLALTAVLKGNDEGAVGPYAVALSQLPDIERVDAVSGSYVRGEQVSAASQMTEDRFSTATATYLSIVPGGDGYGPATERLVERIRALPTPPGAGPALVGGQAAVLLDTTDALNARLPLALGLIGLTTIVLLFLFTGSVVLPLKAIVMNLLSLSAVFGAMVWVFQEGHLTSLIGDPIVTGSLDTTVPILMFCVLFGLSMDYEVFLLSRIKEEHDRTGDNTAAVALGLERTGRLITAAAALLALVFLSFVTSGIAFIKLLGLGVALAILIDATLIRGLLVPAFMRLMGEANWWAPGPLRRLHDRFGISEAGPGEAGGAPEPTEKQPQRA